MFIELWERLRGYDKWIETEATIESSELEDNEVARVYSRGRSAPIVKSQSVCVVGWTDASGKTHTARYAATEGTPLYQLLDGEKTTIRYNPEDPDQFYIRDLLKSKIDITLRWKVGPLLIGGGLAIAALVFEALHHKPIPN